QMVESGDYPEVLWSYVDQVAAGGAAPVGKGEQIRSRGYVSGLGCNRPG
ncbi:MAG: hypothetical protein QOG49_1604, partial [Frankiaceae bacterium]|nr:hypothetical protein [Frankiaceae bacterium]